MSNLGLFETKKVDTAGSAVSVAEATPESDKPETAIDGEPTPVGIYHITLGRETYRWLCVRHVAARTAAGWNCKRTGNIEHECDDCLKERNERG